MLEEQAIQILEDEKYQVHIMVKGLKGQFWPVIEMLKQLFRRSSQIGELVSFDCNQVGILMGYLKSGFISQESQVAEWTTRLLMRLLENGQQHKLYFRAMVQDPGILKIITMGLERHRLDNLWALLMEVSTFCLGDLLNVYLRRAVSSPWHYVRLVSQGYSIMYNYKGTKETLVS